MWGTVLGAVGATVFVLANRGALAPPWPIAVLLTWSGAFLSYVWFVFGRLRVFGATAPVRSRAGAIYLSSVIGMVVLIWLGAVLLDDADRLGLRPALIVVAVGLHFLPFAKVFRAPVFSVLGSLMTVIGAAGLVLGWVGDERAASASAVLTGIVMLLVIARDAYRA